MIRRTLLLVFGVFCGATAVILVKLCDTHVVLLAAYRQLLAAVLLAPLFFRDLRHHRLRYGRRTAARTLLPGIILGGHFASWIAGARMTSAANSSLIVNMVPIVMPLLLYLLVRERLNRGEFLGTAVALAGVAGLAVADFNFSPRFFAGDAVCFGSMVLYALYLALARRNRDFPSLWLYVVPVYLTGGLVCLIASLGFVRPWAVDSARGLWVIVGLAVVPTVMGHSIFNYSMKHLRGQVVGIVQLGQFLFAAVMGYFCLSPPEVPPWPFYPAAALVVAGSAVAIRSTPATATASPEPGTGTAPAGAAPGTGGTPEHRGGGDRGI